MTSYYVICFHRRSGHIYENEGFDSSIVQQGSELNGLREAATSNMYDKPFYFKF